MPRTTLPLLLCAGCQIFPLYYPGEVPPYDSGGTATGAATGTAPGTPPGTPAGNGTGTATGSGTGTGTGTGSADWTVIDFYPYGTVLDLVCEDGGPASTGDLNLQNVGPTTIELWYRPSDCVEVLVGTVTAGTQGLYPDVPEGAALVIREAGLARRMLLAGTGYHQEVWP